MKQVTIKLLTNVLFGSESHLAGETVTVEQAVAEQLLAQGLGEAEQSGNGAGPATSEPEPNGKEQAQSGPRAAKGGK